ncbi:MAG TPA: hypothetical protein VNK41_11975 [Vicinamibacterales bacterium]|nr:hypothetical protein [Vicinamibacterales bacterium]
MSPICDTMGRKLEEHVEALSKHAERQAGAVFFLNGRVAVL